MQKAHSIKHGLFPKLSVRRKPGVQTRGLLEVEGRVMDCALGRGGLGIKRGEGDGITPIGTFGLLNAMVRTDRVPIRDSAFELNNITANDGWCDAVGDRNYNRGVRLPYPASHESLHRDDHLYDIVIVMDHNVTQRMGVGGSAIFFHLAHEDYRPTEGCVAVSRQDMLWLMPRIGPQTQMVIG